MAVGGRRGVTRRRFATPFERRADAGGQLVEVDRLGQIIIAADARRAHGRVARILRPKDAPRRRGIYLGPRETRATIAAGAHRVASITDARSVGAEEVVG